MRKSAISVENLTVSYGQQPVLLHMDLEIPAGTMTAIIGPNGAGKTTLIKSILGLVKPVSGKVQLSLGSGKRGIAYVPQSGSVDWDFPVTVLDVVMMGRYGHLGWVRRPGKREKQMAMEVLRKVGMEAYADRQIGCLSGGQQQRVFLARALIQEGEIYLLDEPFKGVDAQTETVIAALLGELRDQGKTVVVVHHDLRTVPSYFDWVVLMNQKVVASGPVETAFTRASIDAAYGMEMPKGEKE